MLSVRQFEFQPKPVTVVVSPNKKFVAFTKQSDDQEPKKPFAQLFVKNTDGSNERPLFLADHSMYLTGGGVRHFSWSQDSKWIVFDFIHLENTAHHVMDGLSILGVVAVASGKGWLLEERGCEPTFIGAGHTTIEFLSFNAQYHGTTGKPAFIEEGGWAYLRHRITVNAPKNKGHTFIATTKKNFEALD